MQSINQAATPTLTTEDVLEVLKARGPSLDLSPDGLQQLRCDLDRRAQTHAGQPELPPPEPIAQAVVESLDDAVLVKDVHGRYILANAAAAAVIGRPRSEIIGKTDPELLDPNIAKPLRDQDGQVMASGRRNLYETTVGTGDNLHRRLTIKTPYRDRSGRITGVIGISRDITDRRLAEEALQRSEDRFRKIFDEGPWGMMIMDPEHRFVRVNHALCRTLGYSEADLLGRRFKDITHPEDLNSELNALGRLHRGETPYFQLHKRYLRKGGSAVPVQLTASILRSPSGEPECFLGMVEDVSEREQAEESLRASERRYRFLAESVPLMVWSLSSDGQDVDVNDRWREYTGLRPEQASEEKWVNIIHPEDRAQARQRWAQAIATGQKYECEYRLRRGDDGSYRWHLAQALPMKDESGRVIRWFGANTDIHDLKLAQEAAQLNERRLSLAIKSAQLGLWDVDLITGQLTESDQRGPMFGRSLGPAHATVEEWKRDLHPEDRERVARAIEEAMAGSVAEYDMEYRVIGPDGKLRCIASKGSVLRDGLGRPRRLVGISFDITRRKEDENRIARLNQDLQRKVRELETLLDIAPIGIAIAEDAQCRVIRPNRAFAQILGVPGDANISKNQPDQPPLHHRYLRDGRELQPEALPMQTVGRTGIPVVNFTFDLEREDGQVVNLIGNASPLLDAQAKPAGVIGTFWDIADFKRKEEQLTTEKRAAESANSAKDRFLATLSHELRNPLATILNALQVADQLITCRECPISDHRAVVARQARHLARLVDDLLDVSRVSAGKIVLKKQPVDVTEVVRQCLRAAQATLQERQQRVILDLPPQPLLVEGDATRLEQVVTNLLSNASKYSEVGKRIWITVAAEQGDVVIRVRDEGIGLSAETLPRLFSPFMQVDESLDRSQGGLGLGLALTRNLVQMHGGSVNAASQGVGRGSEFIIHLPLLQATHANVPALSEAPQQAVSHRLLLVEDQADARKVLRRLLQLWGHQVEVAEDGPEAVEKAIAQRPDIALVDIGLPGFSGYEVAQRIRAALGSDIYLVALTGYGQPEDVQKASCSGFDMHLTKPVEPTRLEQVLNAVPVTEHPRSPL